MDTKVKQKKSCIFQTHRDNPIGTDSRPKTKLHNSIGETKETKACYTLGVRANVQPKSSFPIGAKVEISPKGFTLEVKSEIGKNKSICPKLLYGLVLAPRLKKGYHQIWEANLQPQKCSKLAPCFFGPNS
jgi:hypothetical protein